LAHCSALRQLRGRGHSERHTRCTGVRNPVFRHATLSCSSA
jgi:hypothetical protein